MNYSGLKMSQHPPKGVENEKKLFRLFLFHYTTNHDQIHKQQPSVSTLLSRSGVPPTSMSLMPQPEKLPRVVFRDDVDVTDAAA